MANQSVEQASTSNKQLSDAMLSAHEMSALTKQVEAALLEFKEEFTKASNWHLGSGLSMVLMIFIVISMIITAIFDKDGEGSAL